MNRHVLILVNQELQRLHALAVATDVSGRYGYSDSSKPDESTREWARKQIEYFHKALGTPVILYGDVSDAQKATQTKEK